MILARVAVIFLWIEWLAACSSQPFPSYRPPLKATFPDNKPVFSKKNEVSQSSVTVYGQIDVSLGYGQSSFKKN